MHKMTIVFAMHFEAGHIVSTFNFAKKLQARGHEIAYLSIPDYKELIENQGFKVIQFVDDLMPLGYGNVPFSNARDRRRHNEAVFSRYLERIVDGTLDACFLSVKADLVICDPFLSYVAIRSLMLGIPAMHLFSSLFLYENSIIPPIISYMFPSSRFVTLFAWKFMFMKFLFVKKIKNMITGEFRFPTRMHHMVEAYLYVAKRSGYACKKNVTYRLNEIGLNLVLPEVMLCTKAFQFPGNIPENRLYLGSFVDFEREETPLALDVGSKPVVYCSLGTAASTYPYTDRFCQAVVEASALRPDWQFVLQISDQTKLQKYASTANLLVSKWVPQLNLLRNASVMVTHGGLNSIMECVGFEVPMVIIPGLRDQPGNAARAVYHDLALTATMKDLEPFMLIKLIAKSMESKDIKEGLKKMKSMIKAEDGLEESIRFIESLAIPKGKAADGRQSS